MATFHFIAFDWFVFAQGGKPQFGVLYCTNYLHLGHKSMMSMVKPIAWNRIETVTKTRSAHLVLIFFVNYFRLQRLNKLCYFLCAFPLFMEDTGNLLSNGIGQQNTQIHVGLGWLKKVHEFTQAQGSYHEIIYGLYRQRERAHPIASTIGWSLFRLRDLDGRRALHEAALWVALYLTLLGSHLCTLSIWPVLPAFGNRK